MDTRRQSTNNEYLYTEEELKRHPPFRLGIRNDLFNFANGFINRWDQMADRETRSSDLGFDFVGRQTDFEGMIITVTKASVPGMTIKKHELYRKNIQKLTELVDEKIEMVKLP